MIKEGKRYLFIRYLKILKSMFLGYLEKIFNFIYIIYMNEWIINFDMIFIWYYGLIFKYILYIKNFLYYFIGISKYVIDLVKLYEIE